VIFTEGLVQDACIYICLRDAHGAYVYDFVITQSPKFVICIGYILWNSMWLPKIIF
jgi:hypothetical protein